MPLFHGKRTANEHRNCFSLQKNAFSSPGWLTCDFTLFLFEMAVGARLSSDSMPSRVRPLKERETPWAGETPERLAQKTEIIFNCSQ
jgi:hypothetical protein